MHRFAGVTHPDFASLVDPLFAARKEGLENAFCIHPL
jgi:hypothetical protein